jgi:hypothetical protein
MTPASFQTSTSPVLDAQTKSDHGPLGEEGDPAGVAPVEHGVALVL